MTEFADLSEPALNPLPVESMYPNNPTSSIEPYAAGSFDAAKPLSMRTEPDVPNSFTSQDEEILTSLFSLDYTDEVNVLENGNLPDLSFSMSMKKPSTNVVDPALVEKLHEAVAKLPMEMRTLFVDRIVATIAEPEGFRVQVEAMTSLATAAAAEAKNRLASAGLSPDDPKCVQLASAVLGAYLARYSAQQETGDGVASAAFMQI